MSRAMLRALWAGQVIAAAVLACQPSAPGLACADGWCPAGMRCAPPSEATAFRAPMCIVTGVCGNGVVDDTSERCDDGNLEPGDGCSADCQSNERCGNGHPDPGEVCDDGNLEPGDGCSASCLSNETCGNGHIDPGEICDPPNDLDCSSDCKSTLQCNNGALDRGEECDRGQGNNRDGSDCRSDCILNRCGDGHVNTESTDNREDCDGAAPAARYSRIARPVETASCNLDCTEARCGDGKLNGRFKPDAVSVEQCDDGNRVPGDGCSPSCQREHCGNGVRDPGEECDDDDRAACEPDCTMPRCGNRILDAILGETCDDGNAAGGDGCSALCRYEVCNTPDPGHDEVGIRLPTSARRNDHVTDCPA